MGLRKTQIRGGGGYEAPEKKITVPGKERFSVTDGRSTALSCMLMPF
jgi:hypothetical protein